jgi:flagellar basal-body rod modification protein FlgD
MQGILQNRLTPPISKPFGDLSDSPVAQKTEKKVDFKSLLQESNSASKEERIRKDSTDLATSSDYNEFIQKLNKDEQVKKLPKGDLSKDDFLKLFVAQLQQQDPLNPKDGAEMASQLAQFNGLEQMMNVNTALADLKKTIQANQSVGNIQLIGKEAVLTDGKISLKGNIPQSASVTALQPISDVKLEVKNASGKIIATQELGNFDTGTHTVQWDGKLSDGSKALDGSYTYTVTAQDSGGEKRPIEVETRTLIDGVDLKESAVHSSNGPLPLSDVHRIETKNEKPIAMPPTPASQASAPQPLSPAAPAKEAKTF